MALYDWIEDAVRREELNLPVKGYYEIYDWLNSHNISRDAAINLIHEVELAMQINREDGDKVNELWEIYQALTMYVNPYREWDD